MEGFHYQYYQSFLLDQAGMICPDTPIEATSPSYFPYYYSSNATQEVSATYESSSSFDSGCMMAPSGESQMCFSSLMAEPQRVQEPPTQQVCLEKKRKNSNETPSSSGQSKVMTKESKSRKQKQPNDDMKMANTKKIEEPPAAYIHVRARRGQATDSHSLAERVRREKISERMKMLQDLVPGCEKVTGKALVLDEIINYVQSLQNQVEFLSIKLTSFNPILYDLSGEEFEGCTSQQEKMGSMPDPQPSGIQSSPTDQPTAFENGTSNYPLMDSSSSYLLHGQGPITFSQDNDNFLAQVVDQRQGLLNQFELNSMFSSL